MSKNICKSMNSNMLKRNFANVIVIGFLLSNVVECCVKENSLSSNCKLEDCNLCILLSPNGPSELNDEIRQNSENCRTICLNKTSTDPNWKFVLKIHKQTDKTVPFSRIEPLKAFKNVNQIWLVGEGLFDDKKPTLTITEGAFSQFPFIQHLLFQSIDLNPLPSKFFPPKISYLNFESVNLEQLPDASKALTELGSLTITRSDIESLPTTGASFKELLKTIKNLHLNQNKLKEIPDAIFFMKQLRNLTINQDNFDPIKLNESEFTFLSAIQNLVLPKAKLLPGCSEKQRRALAVKNRKEPTKVCIVSSLYLDAEGSFWGSFLGVILSCLFILSISLALMFNKKEMHINQAYFSNEHLIKKSCSSSLSSECELNLPNPSILYTDDALSSLMIDERNVLIKRAVFRGLKVEIYSAKYNNKRVAVKKLIHSRFGNSAKKNNHQDDESLDRVKSFIEEIKLLSRLKHDRIVGFIGCYWSNIFDLSCVIEYLPNGDLCEYLHSKTSTHISWSTGKTQIALDILEGLIYLHSFYPKIIHRDLKSRNVLLDSDYRGKLTDFGVSREASLDPNEKTMTGEVGTMFWMAPEILANEKVYTEKADMYSFGVILTELDTSTLPYQKNIAINNDGEEVELSKFQILRSLMLGDIRPKISNDCPKDIAAMCRKCLHKNPQMRLEAKEAFKTLKRIQKSKLGVANVV